MQHVDRNFGREDTFLGGNDRWRRTRVSPASWRVQPTGGIPLTEERLQALGPGWKANHEALRRMDELILGETEPATLFVWRFERP